MPVVGEAGVAAVQLVAAEGQRRDAAPPVAYHAVCRPSRRTRRHAHAGADDLRVKAAGEPAIAGHQQQATLVGAVVLYKIGKPDASAPAA